MGNSLGSSDRDAELSTCSDEMAIYPDIGQEEIYYDDMDDELDSTLISCSIQ